MLLVPDLKVPNIFFFAFLDVLADIKLLEIQSLYFTHILFEL